MGLLRRTKAIAELKHMAAGRRSATDVTEALQKLGYSHETASQAAIQTHMAAMTYGYTNGWKHGKRILGEEDGVSGAGPL